MKISDLREYKSSVDRQGRVDRQVRDLRESSMGPDLPPAYGFRDRWAPGGDLYGQPRTVNDLKYGDLRFYGVQDDLDLSDEFLTSLEGCPRTVGDIVCYRNLLTSFEGAPARINGHADFGDNHFTTLKNVHKQLGFVGSTLYLENADQKVFIQSHVLGLLLVKGLPRVQMKSPYVWDEIINSYLPNHHGMKAVYECQSELIEAGLDAFAQL